MKQKSRKRKLTKQQMRVAIARDVIQQLNHNLLVAEGLTYTGSLMEQAVAAGVRKNESVQSYLLNPNREPCEVCAIGAGLVALIRLENECTLSDAVYGNQHARLLKYFTERQVEVLEALFEAFFGHYQLEGFDADTRLRFLYGYIIKQKGRFTPARINKAAEVFSARKRAVLES